MKRKKKQWLIVDVDSTEDPPHGKQVQAAFNGHFGTTCFRPLFAFTSYRDCLGAKLRPGNVHSGDGIFNLLDAIVLRHRPRFTLRTLPVRPPLCHDWLILPT
ncbi:MAG: transposase [Desulfomonilaceae bacterium]